MKFQQLKSKFQHFQKLKNLNMIKNFKSFLNDTIIYSSKTPRIQKITSIAL